MSQNLSKIIGSVFVVALIISNTQVQSAKIESSSSASTAVSSQSSISSITSSLSAKNSSTANQVHPLVLKTLLKIIDGKKTLELEPDIQMTKEQEKNK